MYKTIRHGENSLQYTILPQNDDFRVENGKLNNANGIKGQYKNKREKKKSFFAYFGLLFICTVIIGAVLIPFLVSTQCLPNPTDWFMKTKNSLTKMKADNSYKYNNDSFSNDKTLSPSLSILSKTLLEPLYNEKSNHSLSKNRKDFLEKEVKVTPFEYGYNNVKNSKESDNPTATINVGNKDIVDIDMENKERKIVDSNNIFQNENKKVSEQDSTNKETVKFHEPVRDFKSNISRNIQLAGEGNIKDSSTKINSFTNEYTKNDRQIDSPEIDFSDNQSTLTPFTVKITVKPFLQVNKKVPATLDLTVLTKKPVLLPVLAKTNLIQQENRKLLDDQPDQSDSQNWIKSHWPFIDPSTYFQWTGYKTEDSVILPAILGVTLVSIILLGSVCLIVRNKKAINSKARKRNRIVKHEESGDDNATLLTTSSLSDDE